MFVVVTYEYIQYIYTRYARYTTSTVAAVCMWILIMNSKPFQHFIWKISFRKTMSISTSVQDLKLQIKCLNRHIVQIRQAVLWDKTQYTQNSTTHTNHWWHDLRGYAGGWCPIDIILPKKQWYTNGYLYLYIYLYRCFICFRFHGFSHLAYVEWIIKNEWSEEDIV